MGRDLPLPPMPRQRIADTVRAATGLSAPSEGESAEMSSSATPCKNEAASAHRCDDEGKEEDRRDDRHRASRSGAEVAVTERGGAVSGRCGRSRSLSFCPANAFGDGRAECIFECRANIVANGQ